MCAGSQRQANPTGLHDDKPPGQEMRQLLHRRRQIRLCRVRPRKQLPLLRCQQVGQRYFGREWDERCLRRRQEEVEGLLCTIHARVNAKDVALWTLRRRRPFLLDIGLNLELLQAYLCTLMHAQHTYMYVPARSMHFGYPCKSSCQMNNNLLSQYFQMYFEWNKYG